MSGTPIRFSVGVESVAIDQKQWDVLLAENLATTAPFRGTHSRRSEDRHDLKQVMQMFVGIGVRNPQRFLVRTRNISRHGVGFVHSRPARRGMRCSLAIVNLQGRLVHLRGTIASSRNRPDGHYDIGLKFDSPIFLCDFLAAAAVSQATPVSHIN